MRFHSIKLPFPRRFFFVSLIAIAFLIVWYITIRIFSVERYEWFPAAGWLYIIFIGLSLTCLPIRHFVATSLATLLLIVSLSYVNSIKIEWTQIPLTFLDLKIFLESPSGALHAVGLPVFLSWLVKPLLILLCALVLLVFADGLIRQPFRQGDIFGVSVALSTVAVILIASALFSYSFIPILQKVVNKQDDVWEPTKAAEFSRRLGIVGFIAYSYSIERVDPSDYFNPTILDKPPLDNEVFYSASKFVMPRSKNHLLPNIVILFGESTLDPFYTFNVRSDEPFTIFSGNYYTQLVGPLHVNTVGGGSWISEFESIVGIDSRLFGYAGFYTHSALSPYVRRSFPLYLREYGYSTAAYYSAEGDFFNARQAFTNYGFEHFYDAEQLGLKRDWASADTETVEAVFRHSVRETNLKPFFKYIGLLENHGWHECVHFQQFSQFTVTFPNTSDFGLNCTLNEYMKIVRSTQSAFNKTIEYLARIEKETGRPFVVAIFGDHQPHSMSGSGKIKRFAPHIVRGSERETFVHIASSLKGVINCCESVPPLTLLPSLLSAYVAKDVSELYLPLNFYQYERCGSNLMYDHLSAGLYGQAPANHMRSRFCGDYWSLVAGFREFGAIVGTSPLGEQ